MLNTNQMIKALSKSNNEIVAKKCQDILSGKTTIEETLETSGSFLTSVLTGDYNGAIARADANNKIALFIYKDEHNIQ